VWYWTGAIGKSEGAGVKEIWRYSFRTFPAPEANSVLFLPCRSHN